MKFTADATVKHSVKSYSKGCVNVGDKQYTSSLIILPSGAIETWVSEKIDQETIEKLEKIVPMDLDVLLIGVGEAHKVIPPKWLSAFYAKNIGVECMNNASSCRTFNFLLGEGRRVALALHIWGENDRLL